MTRVKMEPAERRAEIVAVARKLFMERGVAATPVSAIVKEAGIAQGTFYWYFASKDEALQAVGEDMAKQIVSVIEQVAADPKLNAMQKFRKVDRTFMEMIKGYSPDLVGYFRENIDRRFRENMEREVLKVMKPLYAQIIRQGLDEGLFHCDSPDETAAIVVRAWQGVEAEVRSGDSKVRDRAFKAASDFIYRGLGYKEPAGAPGAGGKKKSRKQAEA